MSEKDTPKTAFICRVGKYEFVRMSFGVRNAPALFQTLMDKLLRDKRPFARAYIDDIIIFSNCWDDHLTHIRQVLTELGDAGLKANPSKCKRGGEQIEFLGQVVGRGVHKIPDKRAQSISNYVRPTTKRELRLFLGSVSYYRQFLDKLATHTTVLSPATAKSAPPKVVWSKDREEAFTSICKCIAVSCTFSIPTDQFSIATDASGLGIR